MGLDGRLDGGGGDSHGGTGLRQNGLYLILQSLIHKPLLFFPWVPLRPVGMEGEEEERARSRNYVEEGSGRRDRGKSRGEGGRDG